MYLRLGSGFRFALRSGLLWGAALLALGSCSGGAVSSTPGGNCQSGQTSCAGTDFQMCGDDGTFQTMASCAGSMCDNTLGCIACVPSSAVCANSNTEVHSCNADGTVGALTLTCPFGQACSAGSCVDSCELAASEFVYLVDNSNNFLSFQPRIDTDPNSVKLIGKLTCPAQTGATPNSMGVDRHARAWVAYSSGEIFWVSPQDASCQKSGYVANQLGFKTFGMGFSSDSAGSRAETLYLGDGPSNDNLGLGKVDVGTLTLSLAAKFPTISSSPELTGTGAAELYGYFPSNVSGQHLIARINKATAQFDVTWQLPQLPAVPNAWAFAHWGGRYYQFVTNGGKNQIRRYDPATQQNVVVQDNTSYKVVGAGVSTCAPYTVG